MSDSILEDIDSKVYKTKVQEMQQFPLETIKPSGALDDSFYEKIDSEKGGVYLSEVKFIGHLVLRGDGADKDFSKAIYETLGVSLPGELESKSYSKLTMSWISPDEWLIQLPINQAYEVESRLRQQLSGHISIVNTSGGQVVLQLSGDNVIDLLKKSTPYNIEESNFPVGKVVSTIFAKTQAVIHRPIEQKWEIVIRRSFADYVWSWLIDGGEEYGLKINK